MTTDADNSGKVDCIFNYVLERCGHLDHRPFTKVTCNIHYSNLFEHCRARFDHWDVRGTTWPFRVTSPSMIAP